MNNIPKSKFLGFLFLLFLSCHDTGPEPIDPTEPIDTLIVEAQQKWVGTYTGNLIHDRFTPGSGVTNDTMFNKIFKVNRIVRDSMVLQKIHFEFEGEAILRVLSYSTIDSQLQLENFYINTSAGEENCTITMHAVTDSIFTYYTINHIVFGGNYDTYRGYYKKN